MSTIDQLDVAQHALLLRIADGQLILQSEGLAWTDGSGVTTEENESLRNLYRGTLIDVVGDSVTLLHCGRRVVGELRAFGRRSAEHPVPTRQDSDL